MNRWLKRLSVSAVAPVLVLGWLLVEADPASAQTYQLLVSSSPNREGATSLAGATVSGDIYVHTAPETGVTRVRFYLDNPTMTGSPRQTENAAPYDFAGTAADGTALPFSTTQVANGTHTITAAIDLAAGGTQVLDATFTVSNSGGGVTYALLVSNAANRANPGALEGASVADAIHVFTSPDTGGIIRVRFFLDNPTMTGAPRQTENGAPYDFAGTAPDGTANPFDTTQLSSGSHTITAAIDRTIGTTDVVSATFTVTNEAPPPASFSLLVSNTSNRAVPTELQGASVSGNIHVFTSPDTGISQVRFFLDNPTMTGAPTHTENAGPFDFAGTAPDGTAFPFDTSQVADGSHTITASITRSDGSIEAVSATFTVTNTVPSLVFSPDLLSLSVAEGGSTSTQVNLNTNGGTASYTLSENAPWLTVDPGTGTTPAALNVVANGAGLAPGTYTAVVTASASGYQNDTLTVQLTVGNGGCTPLPCSEILVDLPYQLPFDADHGKIPDANGVGTGFTYIDEPTNGTGYIPSNLVVDTAAGVLRITTTTGLASGAANSLDNALGVGIAAPNQVSVLSTTLINPPAGTGNFEQAGLWFGVDEDNYVKLIVFSNTVGTQIELLMEVNGTQSSSVRTSVLSLTEATVLLTLRADPITQKISGFYGINGEVTQTLGTVTAPPEFFSFDAAGIDPEIGTRSFGGIFASHRNGPTPLTYVFDDFAVTGEALVSPPPPGSSVGFDRTSFPVPFPTSMVWGPDNRLYVTEIFGKIHAFTLDANHQPVADEVITTLGTRLTLGITVDPESTPGNVILWVSHSSPSLDNGEPNSSTVTRLSGSGFTARQDVITGLPRAIANHAVNSLHFGPDGRLYIAQGGNTGAGAPNQANTEFGTMEEQPLSAAILVADVKNPAFDGSCHNASDIFGPPPCDVVPYATGLRNAYDFTFHSNGFMYAPDNGLGVAGTYPPSPTPPCFGFGDPNLHDPGAQPDILVLVEEGNYYGHPNPYREECVFKDGTKQNALPLPNYTPPIFNIGDHRSANGIVEYNFDHFCGALKGELLIASFSVFDDITRVKLSANGRSVLSAGALATGFSDPLPLALGPDGTVYVGETGANRVTALKPQDGGCWATKQPLPDVALDSGGAALGGKLYLVAGKTSAGPHTKLYIYTPASDTWSAGPNMPGVGVENPAVTAFNGRLYAFGGSTLPFSGAVTNAAVFDPVTVSWTSLAPVPTARGGATAQVISGLIYVVGGMDGSGASLATMDVYNPATNTWSVGPAMATRRDNPGSAVLGGKLYIFGGRIRNADGSVPNATLNTVEMFDPATGTWTSRASMPTGRRTMVVGTLNGRAQVMGGEATASGGAFSQNEEYDPITNTWRSLQAMPTPRHGAAAGTINDVVYVVGGGTVAGSSFSAVNEAFEFGN